jgi:cytidylate kinase
MNNRKMVIAIDGPAGSGKSTIGKEVARRLTLLYIDSGAMYRAFGMKCAGADIDPSDTDTINKILEETTIELEHEEQKLKIILDGRDVSEEIRTPEAGKAASIYSVIPQVREKMIETQRAMASSRGVVMDGRDIGTVVFPHADIKIYLDASPEIRAIRRYRQLKNDKEPDLSSVEFKDLLNQQIKRDNADRERKMSPLRKANDAVLIDSSNMTIEEVIGEIISLVKN